MSNKILWNKILKKLKWKKFFSYVKLEDGEERRNGEIWSPCPFHGEDTPSFSVSKEKGTYYCFGCHESGNLITLIAHQRDMENDDAFEKLKDMAGLSDFHVSIPELRELLDELKTPKKRKIELQPDDNKFPDTVEINKSCLEFLKKRHITEEIATKYKIKRCIEGYYKDYLIIPIKDESGRSVTFEARYVGDDPWKKRNKKVLYPKDSPDKFCVFNLKLASQYKEAIAVEGILDCLSLISRNVPNSITMFGTSISSTQRRIITSNFEKVILFYDPDEAGTIGSYKVKEDLASVIQVKTCRAFKNQDVKYLGISDIRQALSNARTYEIQRALYPLRKRLASLKGA